MDTRIKVDIPDFDSSVTPNYKLFSREHVLELCMRSLRTVREYEWLVQKAINEGSSLQLAWRVETKLDWVWQETDVEGKPRDWDVLCGLSLKQVRLVHFSINPVLTPSTGWETSASGGPAPTTQPRAPSPARRDTPGRASRRGRIPRPNPAQYPD